MKKLWLIIALGVILLPLGLARAAEFASNKNGDIVVPTAETHRNFYTAGDNITVNGATAGDLAAAGQTIVVNGDVENSVFLAGQTVNIRGQVGHTARLIGDSITVSGTIDGDLFVAGAKVTISKDAVINGGLYVASNNVTISGTIKGEVRYAGSSLTINGSTGRVIAYGEVTVKADGRVNGDLRQHARVQAVVEDGGAITGKTVFTKVDRSQHRFAAIATVAGVAILIGWIVFALVLLWLVSKFSQDVVCRGLKTPAAAVGYGIAVLFLLPILAGLLAISIIGLPLAFLVGLLWLLLLVIGSVYGKIALGSAVYNLFKKDASFSVTWVTVVIGFILSALIGFIPVIGPLVKFAFLVIGIGALSQTVFGGLRQRQNSTEAN